MNSDKLILSKNLVFVFMAALFIFYYLLTIRPIPISTA